MSETDTIYYQGKRTAIQVISEVNTVVPDGMDFLLRDEAGRYYLRRELYDEGVGYHKARRTRQSHYRCYVHRISLVAAILWQVDFAAKRVLRLDAGRMLSKLQTATDYSIGKEAA